MFKNFKDSEIVGLDLGLVQMLQRARTYAEIPFVITSGLRTPMQNIAAEGVPDSSHLKGLAVDLRVRNSNERFLILQALFYAGFKRIGDEVDHIHVDIDREKSQNVCFLK